MSILYCKTCKLIRSFTHTIVEDKVISTCAICSGNQYSFRQNVPQNKLVNHLSPNTIVSEHGA